MAGNVNEWVRDFYEAQFYVGQYTINPENTSSFLINHVLRGGGFSQQSRYSRTSNRASAGVVDGDLRGFRCVRDAP
jgi:formylglycine-generating enzyme required for sulfatase activity